MNKLIVRKNGQRVQRVVDVAHPSIVTPTSVAVERLGEQQQVVGALGHAGKDQRPADM